MCVSWGPPCVMRRITMLSRRGYFVWTDTRIWERDILAEENSVVVEAVM